MAGFNGDAGLIFAKLDDIQERQTTNSRRIDALELGMRDVGASLDRQETRCQRIEGQVDLLVGRAFASDDADRDHSRRIAAAEQTMIQKHGKGAAVGTLVATVVAALIEILK